MCRVVYRERVINWCKINKCKVGKSLVRELGCQAAVIQQKIKNNKSRFIRYQIEKKNTYGPVLCKLLYKRIMWKGVSFERKIFFCSKRHEIFQNWNSNSPHPQPPELWILNEHQTQARELRRRRRRADEPPASSADAAEAGACARGGLRVLRAVPPQPRPGPPPPLLPAHRAALAAALSRFRSKLLDLRRALRHPSSAARSRLWCPFCSADLVDLDSRFAWYSTRPLAPRVSSIWISWF